MVKYPKKVPDIQMVFFMLPFLFLLGQEWALASCEEKLHELAIGKGKNMDKFFASWSP